MLAHPPSRGEQDNFGIAFGGADHQEVAIGGWGLATMVTLRSGQP